MAGENDNNAVISNLQQQNQLLKEKIEAIQASLNSTQEKISALEIQLPPLENLEMGSVLATAQLTLQQSSNSLFIIITFFSILIAIASIFGWKYIRNHIKNKIEEKVEEQFQKFKSTDTSLSNLIKRYEDENEKYFTNTEGENVENSVNKDKDVEKEQIMNAKQKKS